MNVLDYLVRTAAVLFVCGAMIVGYVCGKAQANKDESFAFYAPIVFEFALLFVGAVCLWFVGMCQRGRDHSDGHSGGVNRIDTPQDRPTDDDPGRDEPPGEKGEPPAAP